MKIKTMIVLQQEPLERKRDFMAKVEDLENKGYKVFNSLCYDKKLKLAEVTLTKDFDFVKYSENEYINTDEDVEDVLLN